MRVGTSLCLASVLVLPTLVPSTAAPARSNAPARSDELLEVGYPDLSQFQDSIRDQLNRTREVLDRIIDDPESAAVDLPVAYGNVGQLYLLYDFPDLAEACFTNASRLRPDDYRWHYYLAVLYQFDGRFAEAAERLERSLELFPEDVPALIRLGDCRYALGAIDEARARFQEALELDPDSAAAHDGLGRVAAKSGEPGLAIEHFQKALELQPTADAIHHRLGMAYRSQGDLDRARYHLALNKANQVRFRDPLVDGLSALVRSTQMHFNAGVDAMRAGDFEEAVRQFELAYEEKPDDYLVPYNLASALLRVGKREEAERWLRKSIEIEPDFRNGHFNLATMLVRDGKIEEAALHFQRTHEIDPEDQVAHLEWATALSMTGQTDRAAEELENLLELNPSNSQALLNLGIIRGSQGDSERAAASFERVLEVSADPEVEAQAHYRLGILSQESGRFESALDHFSRALELVPTFFEARVSLAWLLGRAGRFSEAAEEFALLIESEPTRMQLYFDRAMALVLAEEYARARQSLEQSLERFPEAIALQHVLARLLATCPEDSVRDGSRALALARTVFDEAPALDHGETVAMALAETGRFEEAIDWQQRVIEQLEEQGPSPVSERARARLELYRQGEPVRAPWRGR